MRHFFAIAGLLLASGAARSQTLPHSLVRSVSKTPVLAVSLFAENSPLISFVQPIPVSAWQFVNGARTDQLPDGTPVLVAGNGDSFFADMGVSPAQVQADPTHPGQAGYAVDGFYKLRFSFENFFDNYPAYYEVKVSFGTQELCSADGYAIAGFGPITIPCGGPHYLAVYQSLPGGGPGQGTKNLIVTFSVSGPWPAYFKANGFWLTFTPSL